MEQFFQVNIGQVGQVIVILFGFGVMFQQLRGDIKHQGVRLEKVETQIGQMQTMLISEAKQDERINSIEKITNERITALDQRSMAQGARIDSTAAILNGRLEAINNIVSGHTAQLNNMPRTVKAG